MWNSEIDEAARAMTAGEPGGDLKARVLAKIDAPRERGGRTRGWIKIAAPVAAALGVAIWVHRVPVDHEAQRVQQVRRVQPVPRVQELPKVQQVLVSSGAKSGAKSVNVTNTEVPPADLDPIAVEPVVIAAIPQEPPIVIDALSTDPIELDEIDVLALAQ